MFPHTEIASEIYKTIFWIAQVPVDRGVNTAEDAALVFSGPKFFMALIAGLVLAFAFQFLLTNLSLAVGISALGRQSDSDNDNDEHSSLGGTIKKIGTGIGIWTLVTVTLALVISSYLAVKLSLIQDWGLGAILGLVIWGAYFTLLVWLSSTTVGSFLGSIINTAISGFQAIVGTATAAIGAKAVNQQVVATAEAAASAVRRELGSAIDPLTIRETLEDYIEKLRPPELDVQNIRREFENLLSDPELKAIAPENLRTIDRQKFVELVSSRTDLSKRDVNRIVDQLESVWKQVVDKQVPATKDRMGELLDYLRSAKPDQIGRELGTKLDQLISEMRSSRQDSTAEKIAEKTPGPMQTAFNTLLGVVMGRTDLSNLDIEKILGQLQTAREQLSGQADKVTSLVKGQAPALPYSTIRGDVENYLLNTYSWQMTPESIARDFREVIYDPQADPSTVRQQLEQLKKSDFVQLLQQRGIFTQAKIQEVADQLESVRQNVLATVRSAEEQEKIAELRRRVENYLRFTPQAQLTATSFEGDFKAWLVDSNVDSATLERRLNQLDRNTFLQTLNAREDINSVQAEQIVTSLINTRDRVIADARREEEEARSQAEALWLRLESYLRNTGKDELNPEAIKQELRLFLDQPNIGFRLLQARLSRFDRDTLVQLLSQRQDIQPEQANRIIDQVHDNWHSVTHAPQVVVDKAKDQYDKVTTSITEYLRNTGKDELNPEGIQRDLTTLLQNPQEGALALRDRIAHIDRDTLVKLLSQRQDLSEEQVNQIIDQVQSTMRGIVRAPRRLAERTKARVQNFQSTFADYLRNTGKDELNPEGIQRDLQLLLHDPRAGMESLSDRLSHIDRSTLVSLLSQRSDISEADANRIVDQVLSVRERVMEQIRNAQLRVQAVIDGIFARIRNYLNSLNRPELNYEGIRDDVRRLFDDPQAGFDALRDRLSHFNRDTLVAIISSREDISEADANRIIDQIERTRTGVLQRAERIQQEAQRRLEEVKYQAQKQAEETRKAAASAAWWLFWTAISSATFSAIAGALAVGATTR